MTPSASLPSELSVSDHHSREVSDLRHPFFRPWYIWLAVFYTVWAILNFGFDFWEQTKAHWPIGAAMALGSYVAGSTPMGGGTVGFPVLVLMFDLPASLGRNFGLAVQSIGMTSASIFILCRRTPIEVPMLLWSMVGGALGLVAGTFWVVPLLPDTNVKLAFACLWMSFGVLTIIKNREICGFNTKPAIPPVLSRNIGLIVGLTGGVATALTGVGIDMLLYTVLVLLFRTELKVAVPTSVMIMAALSMMGVALHWIIGDMDREVFYNWLAAAPVVILGAPMGAFFVSIIPRIRTLYFVSVLCIIQFVWTIYQVSPNADEWVFVTGHLIAASIGFVILYRMGKARASRQAGN